MLDGDFSSIIYKQVREGKDGEIFNMYKFITMVINVDKNLIKLLNYSVYAKEQGENQKFKNDPIITYIEHVLVKLFFRLNTTFYQYSCMLYDFNCSQTFSSMLNSKTSWEC